MLTLSKAAEERIIEAVKQAVAMVDNDGISPTAAIEKVARQEQWGPNTVRFAARAYNTGRQTAQRETSNGILDKIASFPLADAESVVASMWPEQIKQASDAATVSSEYATAPTWLDQRRQSEKVATLRSLVKAAAAAPTPIREETIFDVFSARTRLKVASEEARHQAAVAYDRLLNSLDKLAGYFKKAACDRKSFAEVETAVGAYFGTAGSKLMDWVYSRNHMKEARAGQVKFAYVVSFFNVHEPYNHVQACVDLARNVTEKRAQEALAKQALAAHEADKLAVYHVQPSVPQHWTLLGMRKDASLGAGLAGGTIAGGAEAIIKHLMQGDSDKAVSGVVQDLEDPSHDAKLRQIRTQAMMTDLMNDDVIGGYDPDHVSQVYNQIAQLAPRVAQQPFAMRTLLRRSLQGNVEPFEAREITDIEKTLKDTEGSSIGSPNTKIMSNASGKSIF